MSKIAIVRQGYEEFGRGDVSGILGRVAENVTWDVWASPGRAQQEIPYLAPRHGREGVAQFFASLAALEFHSFQPLAFFEAGHIVLSRIRFDVTMRATGNRFQDEEIHLWRFDDAGRIVEFRHYFDTLKHVEALRPS